MGPETCVNIKISTSVVSRKNHVQIRRTLDFTYVCQLSSGPRGISPSPKARRHTRGKIPCTMKPAPTYAISFDVLNQRFYAGFSPQKSPPSKRNKQAHILATCTEKDVLPFSSRQHWLHQWPTLGTRRSSLINVLKGRICSESSWEGKSTSSARDRTISSERKTVLSKTSLL